MTAPLKLPSDIGGQLSIRDALARWTGRRWLTALVATLGTALVLGLPTDVIPNPVFGRPVPVTWWSIPTLIVTSILGGLLLATYVREPDRSRAADAVPAPTGPLDPANAELDRPARTGGLGGMLTFFAVGCPVCNKLVVVALGTTGALKWFQPLQPILAVVSVIMLAVALRARLRSADSCPTG